MNYDEQPLAFRIKSLSNQIKRLLERTAIEQNDANLTGMQYAILGFLGEQEESANIYQRDIEAEFNIRRSTASGILKLLEKLEKEQNNEYITQCMDTKDIKVISYLDN